MKIIIIYDHIHDDHGHDHDDHYHRQHYDNREKSKREEVPMFAVSTITDLIAASLPPLPLSLFEPVSSND